MFECQTLECQDVRMSNAQMPKRSNCKKPEVEVEVEVEVEEAHDPFRIQNPFRIQDPLFDSTPYSNRPLIRFDPLFN